MFLTCASNLGHSGADVNRFLRTIKVEVMSHIPDVKISLNPWFFKSGNLGGVVRFTPPNAQPGRLLDARPQVSPTDNEMALIRERIAAGESVGLRFADLDEAVKAFLALARSGGVL